MAFHYPINGGGGGGGVTDLNGLTGAVTLSAGNNITLNESGNDIEVTANFTQEGKYMISGGITWSGTGLTYDVSFLNYFFNGNKTANPTQVTLDASDPTDNRFDAIVVDEAGTVTTITGTPSANPEVPAIPEDQLQVTIILVAAGSTTPTITSEEIYMDDPTTNWTFSTYTTGAATGSINFAGTNTPKQGINDIEASTDARLGARFVRDTSFDAFQYTMLQVWVRFTGTAVATNKSLNVRFENSAGTLVANTVNLFNYGLQRGVLNTWQLVVVPITAFGALPATVKGLKMIMAGGTVGVVRQWDVDFMILTNGSVPYANVPTIAFYKDNVGIASQSGINLIEGTGVTIDAVNNPLYNRVDYTINSAGGSPAGSDTQIQYNNAGAFGATDALTFDTSFNTFTVGNGTTLDSLKFYVDSNHAQEQLSRLILTRSGIFYTGSTLNDLSASAASSFSGTPPQTYTVTIDGVNVQSVPYNTLTGGTFTIGDTVTNGIGASGTILSDNGTSAMTVSLTMGAFANGDTIDNGMGVTAIANKPPVPADTFTWTDGTTTVNNVAITASPQSLSDGISTTFGATTGHTLTDSWTWTYSLNDANIQSYNLIANIYSIGDKNYHEAYQEIDFASGDAGIIGSGLVRLIGNDSLGLSIPNDGTAYLGGPIVMGVKTGITVDHNTSSINFNGEYNFPHDDGTSGQALVTDGSGNLSFGTPVAGAAGSTNEIQFNVSGALSTDSDFYYDPITQSFRAGRGTQIFVDSSNEYVYLQSSLGGEFSIRDNLSFSFDERGFIYDPTAKVNYIGNVRNSRTKIRVDETNKNITLYAGNTTNTSITIDDITALVTITNVPTYADDAAATTGGLTTGQLYKTTTSGTTSLNIVP